MQLALVPRVTFPPAGGAPLTGANSLGSYFMKIGNESESLFFEMKNCKTVRKFSARKDFRLFFILRSKFSERS